MGSLDGAGGGIVNRSRTPRLAISFVVGGIIVSGATGYHLLEGAPWEDAFYMTFITVTTIGFGEVFPLSRAGRYFTMALGVGGIGIIFWVGTEFARSILESEVLRLMGLGREKMRKLHGHFIICGYGRMGRWAVERIQHNREPLVVVDLSLESTQELRLHGIANVQGDASTELALREAGIGRAKGLIVCLPDDAHNVYTVLLARQLNPSLRIIARALEEGAEGRLRLAGADKVLNPYRLGGNRLALSAMKPTLSDFLDISLEYEDKDLVLEEIELGARSPFLGRSLAGADIRKKFEIMVIGLKRDDKAVFNPSPTELLREGDILVAIGPLSAVERCRQVAESS